MQNEELNIKTKMHFAKKMKKNVSLYAYFLKMVLVFFCIYQFFFKVKSTSYMSIILFLYKDRKNSYKPKNNYKNF